MGWTLQGYNSQGYNPSLKIKSDYWFIDCNGDHVERVEEYRNRKTSINEWDAKLKIVYGLSNNLYFRGYVLTNDIQEAKSIVKRFNGYLVYQHKYGGIKKFEYHKMCFFSFFNVILFFEFSSKILQSHTTDRYELVAKDLFKEITFGVEWGFIDKLNFNLQGTFQELKKQILVATNTKK